MYEVLDDEQIEQILLLNLIGHMGCSANGVTYIVPICYAYDKGCIYGRTYEGTKLKILRENPNACFQVENIENMQRWQSVICWGMFEEFTDIDKRKKAVQVLQDRLTAVVENDTLRHASHWSFSITDIADTKDIFFRIQINRMTGRASRDK